MEIILVSNESINDTLAHIHNQKLKEQKKTEMLHDLQSKLAAMERSRNEFIEDTREQANVIIDLRQQNQALQAQIQKLQDQLPSPQERRAEHDYMQARLDAMELREQLDAVNAKLSVYSNSYSDCKTKIVSQIVRWLHPIIEVESVYLSGAVMSHLPEIIHQILEQSE